MGSVVNASLVPFSGQGLTHLLYAVAENKFTKGAALCRRLSGCKSLKDMSKALVHCKRNPVGNTGWFAG